MCGNDGQEEAGEAGERNGKVMGRRRGDEGQEREQGQGKVKGRGWEVMGRIGRGNAGVE